MTLRLPAHRVTTAHMGAAYPFQAERGLSSRGVFIGRDVHSGGAFVADGWEWYAAGVVTNPGVLVLGEVGTGKSATLKVFCLRQLVFGRQCWFLDPKGEYDRLCTAARSSARTVSPESRAPIPAIAAAARARRGTGGWHRGPARGRRGACGVHDDESA